MLESLRAEWHKIWNFLYTKSLPNLSPQHSPLNRHYIDKTVIDEKNSKLHQKLDIYVQMQ